MTNGDEKLSLDANQGIDVRVDDLLSRMTLDEKLAQIGCVWSTRLVEDEAFSEQRARELLGNGTGHITRIAGRGRMACLHGPNGLRHVKCP